MSIKSTALVGSLCLAVFTNAAQAAYTSMYSFGDSLSDTGNVSALTGGSTPGFPYFDGNFSNGPVWTDLLGPMLGLASSTASSTGGTNYAWGGARTTIDIGVPSTETQVNQYLIDSGGVADPSALYTIWTGGNDITSGVSVDIENGGLAVASMASDLLTAGAQNILVINAPNVGLTPAADGNEVALESLSVLFNESMATGLDALGSSNVTLLDSFALINTIVADPLAYGLTDVDNNCLATAISPLTGCDTHLFWDDRHPTAAVHQLIADAAFAAVVPVPAAVWLFGSGLLGLVGVARRKSVNI